MSIYLISKLNLVICQKGDAPSEGIGPLPQNKSLLSAAPPRPPPEMPPPVLVVNNGNCCAETCLPIPQRKAMTLQRKQAPDSPQNYPASVAKFPQIRKI